MTFARRVFLIAGIYGLIVLFPLYFMEAKTGRDFPPPITHPEYYYGFVGVALVFQLVFLVISTDPTRYRPMMIPAVLEKASFGVPVLILFVLNRVPFLMVATAIPDLILGVLFFVAYVKTPSNYQAIA